MTRQRWWLTAGVGVVVVGALLAWSLWPSASAPRARQYRDVDACLLADAHGLTGAQAAPVWAGMQDASGTTHARVSYVAVPGTPTVAEVTPYLAGLVQRQCVAIVAVGPVETQAVAANAGTFAAVRFVVVADGQVAGANITRVPAAAPASVRAQVASAVTAATKG